MLDSIDFSHFFIETKDKITPQNYAKINPHNMKFYKCGGVYLALLTENNILNITMAIGKDGYFIHELAKQCKIYGLDGVKFITSENNKTVQVFAKYAQALRIDILKDFYQKGEDGWSYFINLRNSTRF